MSEHSDDISDKIYKLDARVEDNDKFLLDVNQKLTFQLNNVVALIRQLKCLRNPTDCTV